MATKRRKRENGAGTAYQRAGQFTWTAEVTMGYDEWGKRIVRRKGGFASRREALDYIPTLKKEARRKKTERTLEFQPLIQAAKQSFVTVGQCYRSYITRKSDTLSQKTLDTYNVIYKSCLSILEDTPVVIMQPMDWQRLIDKLKKEGKSSSTRHTCLSIIKMINRQAVLEGVIDHDMSTACEIGKHDRKLYHVALTPDEIKDHLTLARQGDRTARIACILMFTGMRANELMNMSPESYVRDGQYFVGGSKTAAGTNRIIPASDVIVPFINDLLIENHFKQRMTGMTYNQWQYKLEQFYREHSELKTHTSHDFRRTFATMMKTVDAPDADKMAIIGHANIEMTRYYQDSRADELRAVVNCMWAE